MDLGAFLGAALATANTLGAFDGPRHTEQYVQARDRAACIEYAARHGRNDVQGALWQCGAFGNNGVAVASDIKSNIIRWQNVFGN